jgi:drug/metabolite transporter (DMT)-like permease
MGIAQSLFYALIAAVGNAMFAAGQKQSAGAHNGLAFVGASALVAAALAWAASPLLGSAHLSSLVLVNGRSILLAGSGLFLTYLGFHLLYTRFGVSQYVLYAVLSILTTTVFLGIFWLREPVNGYRIAAIVMAVASIVLYSCGQPASQVNGSPASAAASHQNVDSSHGHE